MTKENKTTGLANFFKALYEKIFKINDTPQRIALGLGLGVFSGILPGTGPLAALFLAFIFRANRAAALLGSLATNTWLSFVTFILAIKTGSAILNVSWTDVRDSASGLISHFSWRDLFQDSVLKIIWPAVLGYAVVSLALGILVYLVSLILILTYKKTRSE